MKNIYLGIILLFSISCNDKAPYTFTNSLRAPAYPLITIDPYTNGWLFGDLLYEKQISHYTGRDFPLLGAIRVDGEVFRFMGVEEKIMKTPLAVTASQGEWEGKFAFTEPDGDWMNTEYDDSAWPTGKGAFGIDRAEPAIRTDWTTEQIWVRRDIMIDKDLTNEQVYLQYTNDDDAEIYINGIQVVNTGYVLKRNERIKLPQEVINTLKKGKNVIAAHCTNRLRNAIIDFGLSIQTEIPEVLEQTAVQKSVEVLPTQTIFTFNCGQVDLKLTFTAPMLMNDLDLLSRPVNYITYEIVANDSRAHDVQIYIEAGTPWALHSIYQESVTEKSEKDNLVFLKAGSVHQNILARAGYNVYIDWGHFYLSTDKENTQAAIGTGFEIREAFSLKGGVNGEYENSPDLQNRLAFSRSLGNVKKPVTGYFMLGYDDMYSIQYFEENLKPYWNRSGDKTIFDMFGLARNEYKKVKTACDDFDNEMMQYATDCGGKEYAELCALAYRQTLSAHKLTESPDDELLFFSKSLSYVSTVDVTYPSAPLFLLYNVDLLKGLLNPVFNYSRSDKWKQNFAPHDIGAYPRANGQIADDFLPVEESGNMLILTAAIATMEGNALYAEKHWETLSLWADYLLNEGFDPANQINTDNFTGYSAHNTNLSIKAILGIASYARLADMSGKNEIAQKYSAAARAMALKWTTLAADGDHYRFAFDQPDTWSQKYNLVWDKIMKIDVFPHEVREKEVAYYLSRQNEFGLPLDSRHSYTKSDWIIWTATLAPNIETFQQFISPMYRFVNETPNRVPMSDWYWTDKPETVAFQARPVVGGYFIKMMEDKLLNK